MITTQKPVKRAARLTALALTAALLVSGLSVGAFAADATAGKLETHPQAERTILGSAEMTVNVSTSDHLPQAVQHVIGDDNICTVTITYEDRRDAQGFYETWPYITLRGAKGSMEVPVTGFGQYGADPSDDPDSLSYYAYDEGVVSYTNFTMRSQYAAAYERGGGTLPDLEVLFPLQSDNSCSRALLALVAADGPVDASNLFSVPLADIRFTGDFKSRFFLSDTDQLEQSQSTLAPLFGMHEQNFENQTVPGISIKLSGMGRDWMSFRSDITRPEARYYWMEAFNQKNNARMYSESPSLFSMETGAPIGAPLTKNWTVRFTKPLTSGETYRIQLGLLDANHNVIYRQLEYVTIP